MALTTPRLSTEDLVQPPPPGDHIPQCVQVYQVGHLLCWAACVEMVARRYGNTSVGQCDLAQFLLPARQCCPDPAVNCDKDCEVDRICDVFDHARIRSCNVDEKVASFASIQAEIRDRRPVQVGTEGKPGHVMIVCGWKTLGAIEYLRLHDPLYGPDWIRYDKVLTYLGSVWTWTWTGLEP